MSGGLRVKYAVPCILGAIIVFNAVMERPREVLGQACLAMADLPHELRVAVHDYYGTVLTPREMMRLLFDVQATAQARAWFCTVRECCSEMSPEHQLEFMRDARRVLSKGVPEWLVQR